MKYLKVGADGHRHSAAGGAGARQGGVSCHYENCQEHLVVQHHRRKESEDLVQVWTGVALSKMLQTQEFMQGRSNLIKLQRRDCPTTEQW